MMDYNSRNTARGTRVNTAKLNERAVRAIRRNRHGWTGEAMARVYGVHPQTIWRIWADKIWTHREAYP